MITITEDELKEIISNHEHWLKRDCRGWEQMRAAMPNYNLRGVCLQGAMLNRANLVNADLTDADLTSAKLHGAILNSASLYGASLTSAELTVADLSCANLNNADLTGACLIRAHLLDASLMGAYLAGAYLTEAHLNHANFTGANLSDAHLAHADLTGANLTNADLTGANLCDADLYGAILTGADLNGAKLNNACLIGASNRPFIPMACPDEGGFFGWKRCGMAIVKLYIPADAKRSSSTGRKCRCSKAFVYDIQSLSEGIHLDSVCSDWDPEFVYKKDTFVEPKEPFCEDRFVECGSGIHFYMNREEAVNHKITRAWPSTWSAFRP